MYLPLFIDLNNEKALIIGGGSIAYRKAKKLAQSNLDITLICPQRIDDWADLKVNWLKEKYENQPLAQYRLVIAATDNEILNQKIAERCKNLKILCNSASNAAKGDVIFPGVVQEGGFTLALSSQGKTPFLTKKIKNDMKKILSGYDQKTIDLLAETREYIINTFPETKEVLLQKLAEASTELIKEKGSIHEITDWLQRE
ncbi:MAG: bifunctional precorrin-2 dehydrogenase/sirohydrochlorin ferrochelatase [Clostridiales bacterium]